MCLYVEIKEVWLIGHICHTHSHIQYEKIELEAFFSFCNIEILISTLIKVSKTGIKFLSRRSIIYKQSFFLLLLSKILLNLTGARHSLFYSPTSSLYFEFIYLFELFILNNSHMNMHISQRVVFISFKISLSLIYNWWRNNKNNKNNISLVELAALIKQQVLKLLIIIIINETNESKYLCIVSFEMFTLLTFAVIRYDYFISKKKTTKRMTWFKFVCVCVNHENHSKEKKNELILKERNGCKENQYMWHFVEAADKI